MFSKPEDARAVEDIARKFLLASFNSFIMASTTLENKRWYVKGTVVSFGIESSKTVVIDAHTGKIISCL